jgi:uncharacterized protein YqiB (DUF1249 family)
MILIKGFGDYSKIERLFPRMDDEAASYVETLEESGYVVSITNLPAHIDTPERYAAVLLDQFAEMYQSEPTKGH